jgi:hypothetical protein
MDDSHYRYTANANRDNFVKYINYLEALRRFPFDRSEIGDVLDTIWNSYRVFGRRYDLQAFTS